MRGAVEELDDLLCGARFSEAREDARDAVEVGVGVHVGHGIDGESDVEAELVCLTRGGFDSNAGGDADDYDLGDTEAFEMLFEAGVGEGAPVRLVTV